MSNACTFSQRINVHWYKFMYEKPTASFRFTIFHVGFIEIICRSNSERHSDTIPPTRVYVKKSHVFLSGTCLLKPALAEDEVDRAYRSKD